MNAERLFADFDRLSEAPEAVPRLRRFVLDLAARGKLVEQVPTDEPASRLVELIEAEKARLENGRHLRKGKHLPPLEEEETPFKCPPGWEWVRIRHVTHDRGQTVPSVEFTYIDVTSIDKEAGRVKAAQVLAPSDAPSRARKIVDQGDVLYSCVRPYLLNIAVIETAIKPSPVASTAFAVLNGFGFLVPRYIWIVLRSPFMVACVEDKMRGQAYPAINDSDFAMLPFPLPPLAEQHRIVAKVDELMALCDQLDAAQRERERWRVATTAATLQRLAANDEPGQSKNDARFYLNHSPRLITRPEHVASVREVIQEAAVRGQLVPQDPMDESVEDMLQRVLPAGTGRKGPNGSGRSVLSSREGRAVRLSDAWGLTSIGEVALDTRYGTSIKCSYSEQGVPVLRIPNVAAGVINLDDLKFGALPPREVERLRLVEGDMLVVRSNGSLDLVGRAAVVDGRAAGYCYAGYLVRIRLHLDAVDPRYLLLALNSRGVRDQIEIPIRTTVGLKNINGTELRSLTFPLAPLREQRRIVAKVDELMAVCDGLAQSLEAAQTGRTRLFEALLHEALAEPGVEPERVLAGAQ